MPPDPSPAQPADAAALQRLQRRWRQEGGVPWLHGEVARRMAERLPWIRARPDVVVDASVPWGSTHAVLAAAYPAARWIGVAEDSDAAGSPAVADRGDDRTRSPAALAAPQPARRDAAAAAAPAPRWWQRWAGRSSAAPPGGPPARPQPVALAQVPDAVAGLVWANLGLSTAADPPARLAQWLRVLGTDGFLMFSALGPGSLPSLRRLYAEAGWPPPFAPFTDMHDLGDALVHAGFADPVMDQETLTLTWADGEAALADLRRWGANVHPARFAGLRTPRWRRRLAQALQAQAGADGRIALALEIVYGHAFKAAPRVPVGAETRLDAAQLQAMARHGRGPR